MSNQEAAAPTLTQASLREEQEAAPSPAVSKEEAAPAPAMSKEEEAPTPTMLKEKETPIPTIEKEEETPPTRAISKEEAAPTPTMLKEKEAPTRAISKEEEAPTPTGAISKEEAAPTRAISKEEAPANTTTNSKKNLMVAVDDGECSRYALEWALDNLPDYISQSSTVYLITAHQADFGYVYAASSGGSVPDLTRTMQEQQEKESRGLLEKVNKICIKRGVTPTTLAEVGDPKEAICAAIEKYNINLLVIGSHGKGFIKRCFLGSVSNYCVQHARCPVLVMRKWE